MAKKQPVFSPDERKAMQDAARAVWEEVGYDALTAVAEEKGKDVDAISVSRAEVIELALDAGRLEERLSAMRRWTPVVTADLLKRINQADYKTLIAVVRPAFTFARYGM